MSWFLFNLKLAYATEIGAATAYRGHAAATSDPVAAARIIAIEAEELHHRARVGEMLQELDTTPYRWLDAVFWLVGAFVGLGCRFWGDWASAFGAAQFEWGGAGDYARCVTAAKRLGRDDLAEELRGFELQERAHRAYFLDLAARNWPLWSSHKRSGVVK